MALSVYLPDDWEDSCHAELEQHLRPTVRLYRGGSLPDVPFRVLVSGRPSAEQLQASSALRTLIIPFAGIPTESRTLVRQVRPDLAVHNLHHNAIPTAESAIALLMSLAKHLLPADRDLRRGDWGVRYRPDPGRLLSGKNATVIGFGAVGRRVAGLCQALGMRMTAIRRRRPSLAQIDGLAVRDGDALLEVLAETDVLLLCVPETAETRGLLDATALDRLPRGALLVNVARGDIVDEQACFEALQSGQLGGAAFDAWWRYPEDEASRSSTLPAECPFWELDNVVLSPHRGGRSDETGRLRGLHLAGLLNAADRKDPVPNRVDLDRGY